jgi:hypothetical protein
VRKCHARPRSVVVCRMSDAWRGSCGWLRVCKSSAQEKCCLGACDGLFVELFTQEVGFIGDDAIDAEIDETAHDLRVVDGPDVDFDARLAHTW